MQVIVPLAGPDFIQPVEGIKALTPFFGEYHLQYILKSRPWADQVSQYTFVLYDSRETRDFASRYLAAWFKECSFVFITRYTKGAAISAVAGLSLLNRLSSPVIVDLADIYYRSNINIQRLFEDDSSLGGIALVFEANSSDYSYLRCDANGLVVEAAEKRVISDKASAGTYVFRDCPTYLTALAYVIKNESTQSFKGLYYVCPLFNGVITQEMTARLYPVWEVIDIKNRQEGQQGL